MNYRVIGHDRNGFIVIDSGPSLTAACRLADVLDARTDKRASVAYIAHGRVTTVYQTIGSKP